MVMRSARLRLSFSNAKARPGRSSKASHAVSAISKATLLSSTATGRGSSLTRTNMPRARTSWSSPSTKARQAAFLAIRFASSACRLACTSASQRTATWTVLANPRWPRSSSSSMSGEPPSSPVPSSHCGAVLSSIAFTPIPAARCGSAVAARSLPATAQRTGRIGSLRGRASSAAARRAMRGRTAGLPRDAARHTTRSRRRPAPNRCRTATSFH
mmetsp:Transcript_96296/g.294531  ORF Transcript_96296/g.294531 Transcript_96296/m.294531 type:complete len:214 (+) Transcript_96296:1850-2491(+)